LTQLLQLLNGKNKDCASGHVYPGLLEELLKRLSLGQQGRALLEKANS
jgi:hypothetical protein